MAEQLPNVKVGELLDIIAGNELVQSFSDVELNFTIKVGDIIDTIGRDALKEKVQTLTARSMYKADYARTE